MSNRVGIHKALKSYLKNNLTTTIDIAYENIKYIPTLKKSFLAEIFIPNDSAQASLGTIGLQEDFGIYQININTPTGQGTEEAQALVDELTNMFKIGTDIELYGVNVYIDRSTPAQGLFFDDWYTVPFTIYWSCYMTIN